MGCLLYFFVQYNKTTVFALIPSQSFAVTCPYTILCGLGGPLEM